MLSHHNAHLSFFELYIHCNSIMQYKRGLYTQYTSAYLRKRCVYVVVRLTKLIIGQVAQFCVIPVGKCKHAS